MLNQANSMDQKIKCNQCLKQFSSDLRPFKMPTCLHSLCETCVEEIKFSQLQNAQCGFCDSVVEQCDNSTFTLNKQIFAFIKKKGIEHGGIKTNKLKNQYGHGLKKQIKKQPEDNEILLDQYENDTTEEQHTVILKGKKPLKICQEHDKVLEIICLTDLHLICAHCAIFGNHNDHSFKTLKQFDKDFEQNCETVQIIKKRKYILDKKIKSNEQRDKTMNQIKKRETVLKSKISLKFNQLISGLNDLQNKITKNLQTYISEIQTDATKMLSQDIKIQQDFMKWESFCENILNKVQEEEVSLQQKIHLMYGAFHDISKGGQIIEKLDKNYQIILKRIDTLINSISLQFSDVSEVLNSFAKVTRKFDSGKKQSFMSIIQKINLPSGKHLVDEYEDFSDNSFICDYSQNDLSLMIDSGGQILKKNEKNNKKHTKQQFSTQVSITKKNMGSPMKSSIVTKKQQRNQFGTTTMRLGSPKYSKPNRDSMKQKKLMRSKSNLILNPDSEKYVSKMKEKNPPNKTEKVLGVSRIYEQLERVPEIIIADFLKHDLKEVLDLSKCSIKDDEVQLILKKVRRSRKIRGLKISQNNLTDEGFLKMIDYLGSTSNLNISYNQLNESVLNHLITYRDKLAPLRIINLSFNQINERSAKLKIDALKKMGIIVNL